MKRICIAAFSLPLLSMFLGACASTHTPAGGIDRALVVAQPAATEPSTAEAAPKASTSSYVPATMNTALPSAPLFGLKGHGLKKRLFKPSGRIFFDTGSDDDGEVDIFKDGSLTASISLVELYWPYSHIAADELDADKTGWNWRLGPTLGMGITGAADDSDDGSEEASGAPVVLFTAGALLEFPIVEGSRSIVGLEGGYAKGFSADEGLDDNDDGAWYVGLTIDIPWS